MPLSPGTEVGSYLVDSFVGSGGMASVYRVHHRVLGSAHALKVLHTELVQNEQIRARFLEEGRLQAQLSHPGMVRVTDIVSEPGVAGLVMDFLEGRTLAARLADGPLPVSEAVGLMLQILSAVGYAHDRSVIHRDLKPANLMLIGEPQDLVKVLDFGIAKVAGRHRTVSHATMGTYAYMSPEQLENPAAVDRRADIFALGAVLYEMVTAHTAFEGDTEFVTMQRIVSGEYPPLLTRCADAPPALGEAIERALAKHPDSRFPDCVSFAAAIADLSEGSAPLPVWSPSQPDYQAAPTQQPFAEKAPETFAIEPMETRTALLGDPEVDKLLPEAVPRAPVQEGDSRDTAVRAVGAVQFLSGAVNTFLMWMISCSGLGDLSVQVADFFGVPEWISWFGWLMSGLGCVLLLVGLLELTSGAMAVARGERSYRLARLTAFAEVMSLPAGGVLSFFAGLFNVGLLLVVGPPEPTRPDDPSL